MKIKRGFVGYSGVVTGKQPEYHCVIKMNPNPVTIETLTKLVEATNRGRGLNNETSHK